MPDPDDSARRPETADPTDPPRGPERPDPSDGPPGPPALWSGGLQPERTSLAWQRMNLAGLAASLVSARLVMQTHPVLGYVLATLSAMAAAVLTLAHTHRSRRLLSSLFNEGPMPDGRTHLLAVGMLLLVAAGGLVFVLSDASPFR